MASIVTNKCSYSEKGNPEVNPICYDYDYELYNNSNNNDNNNNNNKIKTKGHNVIGVYVFLDRITRFVRKKRLINSLLYYS